jgi:DNA polymerase-1
MSRDIATVDFETKKIESRPKYPPEPVGVAIRMPGGKSEYLAWGHPVGNNCDVATARMKLRDAYQHRVLFHNASFDMDVAECYFGMKPPSVFDDSMYLAFLSNPYERQLKLKTLADKYLGLPPEEQDDLRDWILANVPGARRSKTKWGEHIAEAPVSLVAPYAIGDVDRTYGLYRKLRPEIEKRGMTDAYRREVALTPVTMEMERSGIRVDVRRLKKCLQVFEKMDNDVLLRIQRKLGISKGRVLNPEFNLNSGAQLAAALEAAGKLTAIIKTATGKTSTKITNLRKTCSDAELLQLLSVHSVCEKYITSFMRPWLEQAAIAGGRILPKFNQTRGRGNEGGGGARTGRYSSSDPNLQNVSANVEESQNKETLLLVQRMLKEEYQLPFLGLRDYLLPDEGTTLICVDYNQQELRFLAHFECGVLMRAYLENPSLDIHEYCRQLVKKAIGIEFPRKHIKITVFGIVYGMGVTKLAERLEVSKDVAKTVRDGIYEAVPGIQRLMQELKRTANKNEAMRTWGGREYFCEEPHYDKETGKWWEFEYKMLNYLIQGSSADYTKGGMLNVRATVPKARIAIQVHDELVCMAPDRSYGQQISAAMCANKLNVPMLADPKFSTKSWARAK